MDSATKEKLIFQQIYQNLIYVSSIQYNVQYNYQQRWSQCYQKGRRANVPLFETIKTNAGTHPKNELQQ